MGRCPSRCTGARPHAGKKGHGRLPGAAGCWEVTADQVIAAELQNHVTFVFMVNRVPKDLPLNCLNVFQQGPHGHLGQDNSFLKSVLLLQDI